MVDYKTFEKTIKDIIAYNEWIDKLYNAGVDLLESPATDFLTTTTNLLANQMNDEESYISWWIWECDFGKDEPYVYLADRDNKEKMLTIDTILALYNLLVEEDKHGK